MCRIHQKNWLIIFSRRNMDFIKIEVSQITHKYNSLFIKYVLAYFNNLYSFVRFFDTFSKNSIYDYDQKNGILYQYIIDNLNLFYNF